jgi:hypothetical protein
VPEARNFFPRVSPVVGIVAIAVAARVSFLFHTPYVPGVNGAYYLIQARALIERGVPGIPDLPLTFYLQAAVAWSLAAMGGVPWADAIVWGVKLSDAVFPPLSAWPVYLLVRRWARSRHQGEEVPLAAAALACLAAPLMGMAGDLQKNSLALVWLAMLAYTLHGWLEAHTSGRAAAVLACVVLLGLTHIGVLGAAPVLLAAVTLVLLVSPRGSIRWRQKLPWVAAGALILALTTMLVLWEFDPARIHRLTTALTDPATFSSDGRQMPVPPGKGMGAELWLPWFAFALVVVPGLVIVFRKKDLSSADVSLVAGGALTVIALTGPWFGMDKALRFYLIALLPAIIVGSFSILSIATAWVRRLLLGLLLVIGMSGTAISLYRGGEAVLNDDAMKELQGLAPRIGRRDRTLICTQHGAEWWSAWFLRVHIAQREALRTEDWKKYDSVLFLEFKSGVQSHLFGGGSPPGSGQGPPVGNAPGGAPEGIPPPRMPALMPPGAEVLYDGVTLTLARIATPPDFVASR